MVAVPMQIKLMLMSFLFIIFAKKFLLFFAGILIKAVTMIPHSF